MVKQMALIRGDFPETTAQTLKPNKINNDAGGFLTNAER